jgi:thymidylate synthase (FAD)
MDHQDGATDAETVIEYAGRSCYRSFHRPNPATREVSDYLERTLFDQKHFSIAEHVQITVEVTGVSRAWTHEMVRHRAFKFSQESQRFIDMEDFEVVLPPAFRGDWVLEGEVDEAMNGLAEAYRRIVEELLSRGKTRKQAREAARAILPNATATGIVISGDIRSWIFMLDRRLRPDADAEFQEVAKLMLEAITPVAPSIFEEFANRIEKEIQNG